MVKSRKTKRGGGGTMEQVLAAMRKKVNDKLDIITRVGPFNIVTDPIKPLDSSDYRFLLSPNIFDSLEKTRNFVNMLLLYTVRVTEPNIQLAPNIKSGFKINVATKDGDKVYTTRTNLDSRYRSKPPKEQMVTDESKAKTNLLIQIINGIVIKNTISSNEFLRWFEIRIHLMLLSMITFLEEQQNPSGKKPDETQLAHLARYNSSEAKSTVGNFIENSLYGSDNHRPDLTVDNESDILIQKSLTTIASTIQYYLKADNYEAFVELFDGYIRPAIMYSDFYRSYPVYPNNLFHSIIENNDSSKHWWDNSYSMRYSTSAPISQIICGGFSFPDDRGEFFDNLIKEINKSTLTLPPLEQERLEYESSNHKYIEPRDRFFPSLPETAGLNRIAACVGDACKMGPNATKVVDAVKGCVGEGCRIATKYPFAAAVIATAALKASSVIGGAKSRKRRKSKPRKRLPKTKRRRRKSRL